MLQNVLTFLISSLHVPSVSSNIDKDRVDKLIWKEIWTWERIEGQLFFCLISAPCLSTAHNLIAFMDLGIVLSQNYLFLAFLFNLRLGQCDQMLERKVAQLFPKMP